MSWKDFKLHCLTKQIEKAILKYGKTVVLNELAKVVNLDNHLHDNFHVSDQHTHQNLNNADDIHTHEHVHDHFHDEKTNQHHEVIIEQEDKKVISTRLNEVNEKNHHSENKKEL